MKPEQYAVVQPTSKGRSGWMVAVRTGATIAHDRLECATADREAARAEAQAKYPQRLIWVAGDEGPKPWEPFRLVPNNESETS